MGAGIAANPYLKFFVRAADPGDIECSIRKTYRGWRAPG
jgi:hypothetical protein